MAPLPTRIPRTRDVGGASECRVKRFEGPRLVEVDQCVELVRQASADVLRCRRIDGVEHALEAQLAQRVRQAIWGSPNEQLKTRQRHRVAQGLDAVRRRRIEAQTTGRAVRVSCGHERTAVGGEAHEHRMAPIVFARNSTKFGRCCVYRAGVTNLATMLPDYGPRRRLESTPQTLTLWVSAEN
jgi:hypothetical protein